LRGRCERNALTAIVDYVQLGWALHRRAIRQVALDAIERVRITPSIHRCARE
jgi:hypothetical protein